LEHARQNTVWNSYGKEQCYMNMGAYRYHQHPPPPNHHLKYINFCTLDIYTVLVSLMLPVRAVVE
jgi:hypothetical protein